MNASRQHPRPLKLELSDAELAYMAQAALTWSRDLPPGAVRASAVAGWLTLSGEVLWHYQRQDAAECVRHLPGVAGIKNDITLRSSRASVRAVP